MSSAMTSGKTDPVDPHRVVDVERRNPLYHETALHRRPGHVEVNVPMPGPGTTDSDKQECQSGDEPVTHSAVPRVLSLGRNSNHQANPVPEETPEAQPNNA